MTPRSLVIAAAIAVLVPSVHAQERPARSDPPEVRTAATAERSVQPDLATVTLQFFAEGLTPAEAGRRLAVKADSLRRALGTLGIPHDSLVNRSRWSWWRGRIEAIPQPVRYVQRDTPTRRYSEAVQDTVYRARDAIEVRIHDLRRVGAVLDTALGRGVTEISPIQFSASDLTAAQEEALREATVRARRQAEAIAGASGATLGDVLSLSTQSYGGNYYSPYSLSGVTVTGASGGDASTVIVRPAVPVSVTVYGRWALVKK